MRKPIDVSRLRWLLLGAKTCAAIALLFALTMPLTTCSANGSLQEHRVEFSREDIHTIACYLWPIPLLLAQFSIGRVRRSFPVLLLELFAALIAWVELTMEVFLSTVVSLGGIHPADGFSLASSSLIGYFMLSVVQLTLTIAGKRAALPATA